MIKNIIKSLVVLTASSASVARADQFHLLSLDRFSLEQYQIINNRDDYFPYPSAPSTQEHWTQGTAARFDIDLVSYDLYSLYYRGTVHGETTNQQYRQVGLKFETGFEMRNYINLFWWHDSEHILDTLPYSAYPLQNLVGVRVTFYKRDR